MFKLASEKELLDCFRPTDRDSVILNQDLKFPILVKDYLNWIEPSGHRVYLIFSDRLKAPPLGVVFERNQTVGSAASMCEWCHSVRNGENVGLLSVIATSKKRVGLNLCRDLSCKDKVEGTPGVHDFPTTQSAQDKIRTVMKRMGEFARRELF